MTRCNGNIFLPLNHICEWMGHGSWITYTWPRWPHIYSLYVSLHPMNVMSKFNMLSFQICHVLSSNPYLVFLFLNYFLGWPYVILATCMVFYLLWMVGLSKNASSQPWHIKNHWVISSWCLKALVSSSSTMTHRVLKGVELIGSCEG